MVLQNNTPSNTEAPPKENVIEVNLHPISATNVTSLKKKLAVLKCHTQLGNARVKQFLFFDFGNIIISIVKLSIGRFTVSPIRGF